MSLQKEKPTAPGRLPETPNPLKLLRIWFWIGAQSFGGGPSTQQLIRQQMTIKREWISEAEYVRFWTLCVLVPGINLIAFAILIGNKLAGWRGILATLIGMLFPSSLITVVLTAGFISAQQWPPFQAMLRGILPATAGLMFVFVLNMGRPLLKESGQEGRSSLAFSLAFITSAALLLGWLALPVWIVLPLAAGLGAFVFSPRPVPSAAALEEMKKEVD